MVSTYPQNFNYGVQFVFLRVNNFMDPNEWDDNPAEMDSF